VSSLPHPVRQRVVSLASDVLGGLEPEQVPASLRQVARFTAAKRARLGGSAIAAAVEVDPGFRRRVLDAARTAHPGLVETMSAGPPPPAADPADVAVVAYLLHADGWDEVVATAAAEIRRVEEDEQATRADVTTVRLREQLTAARADARDGRDRLKAEIDRLKAENAALRRRANQARDDAARAAAAGQSAAAEAARSVEIAESARASAEAEARRLRGRLTDVEEALSSTRRAGREGRSLETARLALLLDTLSDAAAGLRRELALPVSGMRPADAVDAAEPTAASTQSRPDDSASLDDLLALPHCHLVVDGYNVTKGAWATMPLEAQRTRLVQRLAALSARTGAEVTCVFDGADVSVPPSVIPAQGVRVRFSAHGQTADELIRRLVAAEPPGRPVIVVSSDREVADGVRSSGARAVDSHVLVALLG
jgi:predicted RNA-binding protein with PIN domain/cell division protein FtsB